MVEHVSERRWAQVREVEEFGLQRSRVRIASQGGGLLQLLLVAGLRGCDRAPREGPGPGVSSQEAEAAISLTRRPVSARLERHQVMKKQRGRDQ
ncbi:MAG: hypothetical protein ACJAQ3_001704 [Planctomycetota bacterium]|jgi:hypothetical protein